MEWIIPYTTLGVLQEVLKNQIRSEDPEASFVEQRPPPEDPEKEFGDEGLK